MLQKIIKGHKYLGVRSFSKQSKPVTEIIDRTSNPKKEQSLTF
jgi:hypothetical protein